MPMIYDPISGRTVYVAALVGGGGGSGGGIQTVLTIAERNALTDKGTVYVVDARGDSTVTSGGAVYIWNVLSLDWDKISEAESLEVAQQIIAALTNYYNKTQIDNTKLTGSFTTTNLSNGRLTITHTQGNRSWVGKIQTNTGEEIEPDLITCVNNAIYVDLTSYITMMSSNTWTYLFIT